MNLLEPLFEKIMLVIKAVRNRRAEMNVPPSKKAKVCIQTNFADTFSTGTSYICRLASASEVEIGEGFDAEGAVRVVTDAATVYMPMKELVDIYTPNEFETEGLENVRGEVVGTLGAKGCAIRSLGVVVPAVDHGKVVDTTGAGDTFNGVLAARLAQGEELASACRAANLAAGIKVTRRYVLQAIPHREEMI